MVPTRMNDVIAGVRSRKRVRRPCDSMATPGQNVSSNTKNTLRRAMTRLRWAKAHARTHSPWSASARELNEHLLEVGLLDLAVAHEHRALVQPPEHVGQPLVDRVHRALDALALDLDPEDAREVGEPGRHRGIEPER